MIGLNEALLLATDFIIKSEMPVRKYLVESMQRFCSTRAHSLLCTPYQIIQLHGNIPTEERMRNVRNNRCRIRCTCACVFVGGRRK